MTKILKDVSKSRYFTQFKLYIELTVQQSLQFQLHNILGCSKHANIGLHLKIVQLTANPHEQSFYRMKLPVKTKIVSLKIFY